MKLLFFTLAVLLFGGCKPASRQAEWSEKDWLGAFTNDTITLRLNEKGVCTISYADSIVGGDYVWDVDNTAVLVTDRNSQIHVFYRNGKQLVSPEGCVYRKK